MASQLAANAIQPVIFLILVNFLTPEDFGVMTAAFMVIAFTQIFWEAGLAKALIQRQSDIDEAANVSFWINIGISIFITLILYNSAGLISENIFNNENVELVLKVMSLHILLGAISSVHVALLQKEMDFKRLFIVRFVTTGLPGIASLPLAWSGYGYWALVAGTLVGQFVQVIMLSLHSNWRPKLAFDYLIAKQMIAFGKWVVISGLLAWFFFWADYLIISMYLDSHHLGIYKVSNTVVILIVGLIAAPILPVFYSLLSSYKSDLNKIRSAVAKAEKILAVVLFPVGAGILIIGESIAPLLFSNEWEGVGEIVGIIALTQVIAYTISFRQESYRAIGRPDIETKVMLLSMMIRVPFYIYSIEYGLYALVVAKMLSTMLGVINHIIFSKIYLGIRVSEYISSVWSSFIAASLMMVLGGMYLHNMLDTPHGYIELISTILLCTLFYMLAIFMVDKKVINEVVAIIKRK